MSVDLKKNEKVRLSGNSLYVYKNMGRAMADYEMLKDGDKILVGVSGGEDSLSLLKLFMLRKPKVPIDYEIVICFVATSFVEIDEDKLKGYFDQLNVPYVTKVLVIDKDEASCFWCSWNRRKILFETAKELGCNKVALGHHLDDIVETTLMNMFYKAEISTMKPRVSLFGGEIEIIRPLAYVPKTALAEFARFFELPVVSYECEYGKNSKRLLAQKIIKEVENDCSYVKKNIFNSLKNIKEEYLT